MMRLEACLENIVWLEIVNASKTFKSDFSENP